MSGGKTSSSYTPVIKLNSPLRRIKRGKKDLYIIAFQNETVQHDFYFPLVLDSFTQYSLKFATFII